VKFDSCHFRVTTVTKCLCNPQCNSTKCNRCHTQIWQELHTVKLEISVKNWNFY